MSYTRLTSHFADFAELETSSTQPPRCQPSPGLELGSRTSPDTSRNALNAFQSASKHLEGLPQRFNAWRRPEQPTPAQIQNQLDLRGMAQKLGELREKQAELSVFADQLKADASKARREDSGGTCTLTESESGITQNFLQYMSSKDIETLHMQYFNEFWVRTSRRS